MQVQHPLQGHVQPPVPESVRPHDRCLSSGRHTDHGPDIVPDRVPDTVSDAVPDHIPHNVADHESMPRCPVRKVGPVKWLLWMASNGLPGLYGSLWM